jgi:hypothetical protein
MRGIVCVSPSWSREVALAATWAVALDLAVDLLGEWSRSVAVLPTLMLIFNERGDSVSVYESEVAF